MIEKSDRELLVETHLLLGEHVKTFESHVELDDRREEENKIERRLVAVKLVEVQVRQERMIGLFLGIWTVVQIGMKMWK